MPSHCRHCDRHCRHHARGLCRGCFDRREVRKLYRVLKGRAGSCKPYDPEGEMPAAGEATEALPGTDEKLRVLAERLAAGVGLHHPADARATDGL